MSKESEMSDKSFTWKWNTYSQWCSLRSFWRNFDVTLELFGAVLFSFMSDPYETRLTVMNFVIEYGVDWSFIDDDDEDMGE